MMTTRSIIKAAFFMPALALILASCSMKDKGNYDYIPGEEFLPVEIEDFDLSDVGPVLPKEPFYYEPVFTKMDDESRYSYRWYTIGSEGSVRGQKTELADTKVLDLEELPLVPGRYNLYYEVKDQAKDVRVIKETRFTVEASSITTGIFILKDVDGNTDIDYHYATYAHEPIPDGGYPVQTDIVSAFFGQPWEGSPVSMTRSGTYRWQEPNDEGVLAGKSGRAYFILTEKDIVSVPISFASRIYPFEGHFYESVWPINPKGAFINNASNNAMFLINDNQIYGYYGDIANIGKFTPGRFLGGLDVMPQIIMGSNYALFYDRVNGEFFYNYTYNGSVNTLRSVITESHIFSGRELITGKMVEPIAMLQGGGEAPALATAIGYIVLKHKTDASKFYTSKVSFGNNSSPAFQWIREMEAEADLAQTPTPMMVSSVVNDGIYYVKNNTEVWLYTNPGDSSEGAVLPLEERQKKQGEVGAGETIVAMQPQFYYSAANLQRTFRWLVVLTQTPEGGYKMYAFDNDGANSELLPSPRVILRGEGNAKGFLCRFSSQSTN